MSYFLELQVKQSEEGILINQAKYTRNLLKRFHLQDYAIAATPMATSTKLDPNIGESMEITNYREMIGSLLYLTASKHDIMYPTYLGARF